MIKKLTELITKIIKEELGFKCHCKSHSLLVETWIKGGVCASLETFNSEEMTELFKHLIEEQSKNSIIEVLEKHNKDMLSTLKLAYRKHCQDDTTIGYEELDKALLDTLCNVMGNDAYQKWLRFDS